MKQVKYCTDCKWSKPEINSEWNLRCAHPEVNARDPWALSAKVIGGTSCREEREVRWFATCGMKGKLWMAK
jgi:hypothetical protein